MDLLEAILEEHSKRQSIKIADWIGNNEKRFNQLIDLFFNGDEVVVQRSAWVLSHTADKYPVMVQKNLPKLVEKLNGINLHDAVKRNIVRILQFLPAPKRLHAQIMNVCFNYLSDPNQTIAVRCNSMTVLLNLSKQYPEIKNELRLIINGNLKSSSAGFAARSKKVLKELDMITD